MATPDTMEQLVKNAQKLIESLGQFPELQVLPGYREVKITLVNLGIMKPVEKTEPERDKFTIFMENELGPLFWIGLFTVPYDTGETKEIPLVFQSESKSVVTYTTNMDFIPELIEVCNTLEKSLGYPWRLVEYRGETEWNKEIFGKTANHSIH